MKKIILITLVTFAVLSCSQEQEPNPEPPLTGGVFEPEAAVLVSPINNATCEEGINLNANESAVTFNWETAEHSESYGLVITNLITQVVTRNNPIFEPTATATLLRGVPYSWHVVSYGTDVSLTATSNTWKFYLAGEGIANYAPFPPQIVEPASGATISPNDDGNIVLSWQAQDVDNDPLTFTVFVDTVDGFQEPLAALSNIENTIVEVAVTADEVYFWRVKVHDGHHETTSPVYTFRTQ